MTTTSKIYIDIQSLLDVRQSALIAVMGEEEAVDYVNKEDYFLRTTDEFVVDTVQVKEMLDTGDVRCLNNATITYMVNLLTNSFAQMEKLNAFNGDTGKSELLVNIYPFQLQDDTVAAFRNAIFIKLKFPVIITVVSKPLSAWSPSFIKHSGIRQFYCYDTSGWLVNHADKIESGDLRDCRLFFPSLGHTVLTSKELKDLQKLGFRDIFAYTEFLFATHAKIQFLPVVFYSNLITATVVLDKVNVELAKTPMKTEEKEEVNPDGHL